MKTATYQVTITTTHDLTNTTTAEIEAEAEVMRAAVLGGEFADDILKVEVEVRMVHLSQPPEAAK